MPFSSGTFTLVAGNPVVTGTTISSTWANNTLNDIANNGLSICLLKDGTQTVTANIPMAGYKFTGLGAGTANGNSVRWEQSAPGVMTTTGDMVYASAANTLARLAIGTAGQVLQTNSGATAPTWVASGLYRSIQVFTGNGTWTKPAGLVRVNVTVVGGGGAGGGAAATAAGEISCASGGGGGGAAQKTIAAASLGATETVTVGAAGAAVAGTAGTNGGTTSFGAHCSATGGVGGPKTTNGAGPLSASGARGGVGSGGDVNIGGASSNSSAGVGSGSVIYGSAGGSSILGGGGTGEDANSGTGIAAQGYGGGGGGTASDQSQAAVAGGAATAGIVIVEEFF